MIFGRGFAGILLACLSVFCCAPFQHKALAQDGARRIAVVNVSRVFEAYTKVKDVQEKMKQLFDPEKQAMEKEAHDLKNWNDKLQVDPRNPKTDINFVREVQKFELAKLEFETKGQDLGVKVEERRKDEMKIVLGDIKNAIRYVGTAEKYDLVLRAPEFDEIFDPKKPENPDERKNESAAELVRKFRENPVLFFSQGVDVTDKVISKLNDDYKSTGPGPGPK